MSLKYGYLAGALLLYLAYWIAISGSFHLQQLLAGVVVALFIAYLNRDYLIPAAKKPALGITGICRLISFGLLLLIDIVKANFIVAWVVLQPRMPISPQMVWIDVRLKREGSRVLLANSITLTPGTLTVLAGEDRFLVHALTEQNAAEIKGWPLAALLQRVEEGSK